MRDFASINQALAARIDDLVEVIGLGPMHSRTSTGWRFGRRGSMAIRVDGRWFCHETANHGDMVGLVHSRLNLASMAEAARWAESFLGGTWRSDPVPPAPAVPRADDGQRTRKALAIWEEAMPLSGTLAERYLISRGKGFAEIAAESGAVRYHHRCPFGNERLPCVIALMSDPLTGAPTGCHRTALTSDGKKIDRRMLGKAGVVRLSPDEQVTVGIGIAEGAETALAVMASGWRPVWAALSAGGIARFPVLPYVESISVFCDHDPPGLAAAQACADRWRGAGREARIVVPPREGDDWNDFLRRADHVKS